MCVRSVTSALVIVGLAFHMMGVAVAQDKAPPSEALDVPGLHVEPSLPRPLMKYAAPSPMELAADQHSEIVSLFDRYSADRHALRRFYRHDFQPKRRDALRSFTSDWLAVLEMVEFETLSEDAQVDYLLFRNMLEYLLRSFERDEQLATETDEFLPFISEMEPLIDAPLTLQKSDGEASAITLSALAEMVNELRGTVKKSSPAPTNGDEEAAESQSDDTARPLAARRAAGTIGEIRRALREWYSFHQGYDPSFTWWVEKPHEQLQNALDEYGKHLRDNVGSMGKDVDDSMVGQPLGAEGLASDLAHEMIPYTPEELIEIAKREMAWCEERMLNASERLGYGDDWHAALEYVKTLHVEPGDQPRLIRDLAIEAEEFLIANDLVTVPQMCRDLWRMNMMSPERQRYTPFFTGGEVISIAFPTNTMEHDLKVMSLRANNVHFSRATVHHELIPGHHLQGYMNSRHRPYRGMFRTPFWIEGWALYWEMRLWDLGFAQSPENEIGMLFWRMHRCARIIFSLSYHLETMTPTECVDLLVERVGHEQSSAEAEVRRSITGGYSPLYQAAYMLGGIQFRTMHKELVESGHMTEREFHDAILHENAIPIELLRAKLRGDDLTRDFKSTWRFAD